MSNVPLPPLQDWNFGYTTSDMHAHAAAVSAALLESMASERHRAFLLAERVRVLEEALELIAAPMRPDGTWNRERLACQQIAVAALKRED